MSTEEDQIYESSNNGLMNLFILRKAYGLSAKSLDPCTQSQVIHFDFLGVLFPTNKLVSRNPFFTGKVMIRYKPFR